MKKTTLIFYPYFLEKSRDLGAFADMDFKCGHYIFVMSHPLRFDKKEGHGRLYLFSEERMKEIFYVDLYFATNFLMDLVSLAIGALSASRKVSLLRLCLSALLGAVFSTLIALFRIGRAPALLLSILVFMAMIAVCFGVRSPARWAKPALFSFAGAVFLGGAAQMLSYLLFPVGSANASTRIRR